jgi:hypothetical protein
LGHRAQKSDFRMGRGAARAGKVTWRFLKNMRYI